MGLNTTFRMDGNGYRMEGQTEEYTGVPIPKGSILPVPPLLVFRGGFFVIELNRS